MTFFNFKLRTSFYTTEKNMEIRYCKTGEELLLHRVFHTSVHLNTAPWYTKEQMDAWSPERWDKDAWIASMQRIRPLVAVEGHLIVGYADLQDSGYIDQFYVRGGHAGNGIGSALLQHLVTIAETRGTMLLYTNASLAAQPFFLRHGFSIVRRQTVVRNGTRLENARMEKPLRLSAY
jgi:putative acetyltransferase